MPRAFRVFYELDGERAQSSIEARNPDDAREQVKARFDGQRVVFIKTKVVR